MAGDDVMNGQEVAEMLRYSYFTIIKKAKAGELPCFKFGGKVFFRRAAIEK